MSSVSIFEFGGINSKVELQFTTPSVVSLGAGLKTVEVFVMLGTYKSALSFDLLYIPPAQGSLGIASLSPAFLFGDPKSDAGVLTVEVTNVPLIDPSLTVAEVQALFDLQIRTSAGSDISTSKAMSIKSSSHSSTVASFPLSLPLAQGTYRVFINYKLIGADRAGKQDFMVLALGDPVVVSLFPRAAKLLITTSFSIAVQYFPLVPSNLIVSYAIDDVWYPGSVLSQRNSAGCKKRACNTAIIDFTIQPINRPGTTRVRVCSTVSTIEQCAATGLELVAAEKTQVYSVEPKEAYALASSQTVSLYVRNLPNSLPGGRIVTMDMLRVKIDDVSFAVDTWIKSPTSGAGQDFAIIKFFISENKMNDFRSTLKDSSYKDLKGIFYVEGDYSSTSSEGIFTFRALRPNAWMNPVDASSSGGATALIRVYWDIKLQQSDPSKLTLGFAVTFGTVPALVRSVVYVDSGQHAPYTTIAVTTPKISATSTTDGFMSVAVTAYGITESIPFHIFEAPRVSMVLPTRVTLDGQTGECDACLFHNQRSLSLWVTGGMPTVTSTSELSVELFSNNMNSVKCDGQSHGGDNAQARCHILNVQNLAEGLYVAISVPPRAQASAVTVTVSFLGTDSPPPGMTLTDSYTRTRRVATSKEGAFSYVDMVARLLSVLYCNACGIDPSVTCLSGTVCQDGSDAVVGRDTDAVVPLVGLGGALTFVLADVGIMTRFDVVTIFIGESSGAATVQKSTKDLTILQMSIPARLTAGFKKGRVVVSTILELPFTALVYDASITITCVTSVSPYREIACSSPGGNLQMVQITNFNVEQSKKIYTDIGAYFGDVASPQVTYVCCSDGSPTLILSVAVPAYNDPQIQGAFSSGRADLAFKIVNAKEPSTFAFTIMTIWAPPRILSARFEPSGTALLVTFDQPTNTMTLAQGAGNCASIITVERSGVGAAGSKFTFAAGMGTNTQCMWQDNDVLRISLASDSDIQVDDTLKISATSNVRSKNGVSLAMIPLTSAVKVEKPVSLSIPSSFLIAPSSVDVCSSLELRFVVSSPRKLDYFWSCANNAELNSLLRSLNSARILLVRGTPELPLTNFTYVIKVFATDFFGVSTPTLTTLLLKTSSARLSISIAGRAQYFTTQEVLFTSSVAFSECFGVPQAKVLFDWKLKQGWSGSFSEVAVSQGSKPELYIEPRVLPAGRYSVTVFVASQDDASQTSSATFDFIVVPPEIVAMLLGGSITSMSQYATLTLDASGSYDPEVGHSSSDAALGFRWTCELKVGDSVRPCLTYRNEDKNAYTDLATELDLSKYTTAKASLRPFTLALTNRNSFYIFSVAVSKGTRISMRSKYVSVFEADAPMVVINSIPSLLSPSPLSNVDFKSNMVKMNADTRLNLEMMPELRTSDLSYRWSVQSLVIYQV
jgi:hypothetical protein